MNITNGFGISISNYQPTYIGTTGTVRWNGMMRCLEVSTNDTNTYGSHWLPLANSSPVIGLDLYASQAVTWAQGKMMEELRLTQLELKHPELKEMRTLLQQTVVVIQKQDDDLLQATSLIQKEKEINTRLNEKIADLNKKCADLEEKLLTWKIIST